VRRPACVVFVLLVSVVAGCGDGDGDGVSAPTGPAGVPREGAYRYVTTGFERIGGPLPGRLNYPRTSTVTVDASGCILSELWEPRPERYAEWRYCVTGGTWRLRSVIDYHEFFGNAQRRAYRCSGRAVPRPATIRIGFRWTDRCRARRTTAVARAEAVAIERVPVGGERVPAVHLRVRTQLGGDVRGAYTMDSWLRRIDGLLLRRRLVSDTRVDALVGSVPAHEQYELRLSALEPGGSKTTPGG
jgi:hypothetical protein